MAKLDAFFKLMFDTGASDLHIVAGQPPILRVHGDLERIKYDPLDDEQPAPDALRDRARAQDQDLRRNGRRRLRLRDPRRGPLPRQLLHAEDGCGAVFRQIPTKILTADELGLPPILKRSAMLHKGLVLVTGPTGSGKSTTLAAIVDHANKHRKDHIITVEDPIEFVHESQGCLVNHREVGDAHAVLLGGAARRPARRPGHHSRR